MITKAKIDDFFKQSAIAIVGVSRKKNKFGRTVFDDMKKKGMNVFPINQHAETIDGNICYKDISSLPSYVNAVVIITKKSQTLEIAKLAILKGIQHVWIQQGSDTNEVLDFVKQHQVALIHGKCIMMFSPPVGGVHKFHRSIMNFFGRLPK